jgi:uncharacterized protein YlxW (UPF0749 family)
LQNLGQNRSRQFFAVVINPFKSKAGQQGGIAVISVVAAVVGVMGAMAFGARQQAEAQIGRLPGEIRNQVIAGSLDLADEVDKLRKEVQQLRSEKTALENAASEGKSLAEQLNETLQNTKLFAGLTEVEGPGVTVVMRDSRKKVEELTNVNDGIIHDSDVVRVINELWNAGAEAITVNNKRAGPNTSYRCVGSVIVVDGVRFASPIVIRAIGDTKTLYGALTLPGGVVQEIQATDASMIQLEVVEKLHFDAFDGSTTRKFAAVPVEDDKKKTGSEDNGRAG